MSRWTFGTIDLPIHSFNGVFFLRVNDIHDSIASLFIWDSSNIWNVKERFSSEGNFNNSGDIKAISIILINFIKWSNRLYLIFIIIVFVVGVVCSPTKIDENDGTLRIINKCQMVKMRYTQTTHALSPLFVAHRWPSAQMRFNREKKQMRADYIRNSQKKRATIKWQRQKENEEKKAAQMKTQRIYWARSHKQNHSHKWLQ